MFESIVNNLANSATEATEIYVDLMKESVVEYVTRDGTFIRVINSSGILEFTDPAIAGIISFIRYVLVDVVRIYTVLLAVRYAIQFSGSINPYDGGWIEAFYSITTPYVYFFLGTLPNFFGVDAGLYVGFYVLDRLDALLTALVILDSSGAMY